MEIYFDNNACTPIDPRVLAAYQSVASRPGNAHSLQHTAGETASLTILEAAEEVAALVEAERDQVCFAPGATAALHFVLDESRRGRKPFRVLAGAADHPAVLDRLRELAATGEIDVTLVPADGAGRTNLDVLAELVASTAPDLVFLLAANNEVGTCIDLDRACQLARANGAIVVVDACQAAGRIPLSMAELACDHLVMSGAKLYGPIGVAAIISSRSLRTARKTRFGTPDTPGIAAMGVACRLRRLEMSADEARIARLRDALERRLVAAIPDIRINGDAACRLAGTINIAARGVPNDAVLGRLHGRVALSSGAACHSGALAPSHVLTAMGAPDWVLDGSLRISIGKFNTEAEIEAGGALIVNAILQTQAAGRVHA